MKIFDSSLIQSDRENEFKPVLSAILDPLIQACTISATKLDRSDMALFMVNCLHVIQSSISKFNFTKGKVDSLSDQIKAHMHTFIEDQNANILRKFEIGNKLSLMQTTTGVNFFFKIVICSFPLID